MGWVEEGVSERGMWEWSGAVLGGRGNGHEWVMSTRMMRSTGSNT